MRAYAVGGWVRDRLLAQAGYPVRPGDRDWVVVGATPEEMVAQGYQPVGRDFPVFLHPQTREEYALARTERKTAPGYRGFVVHASPEVTLEQDLARRDLTINAMALDEAGRLIDPYGGQADLRARILRHIGPAFSEDPVRILRLARFAARFADFAIAPETMALARGMVAGGEADALVPERVWQEIARGLMEDRPARMIEVLADTGLLARIAPELAISAEALAALDRSASGGAQAAPLALRFAVLASCARSGEALRSWLERLRADAESMRLARLQFDLRAALRAAPAYGEKGGEKSGQNGGEQGGGKGGRSDAARREAAAARALSVLERADALRRPARFELLLAAVGALEPIDAPRWRAVASAAAAVDAGAIAAKAGPDAAAIARAVAEARRAAIATRTAQ